MHWVCGVLGGVVGLLLTPASCRFGKSKPYYMQAQYTWKVVGPGGSKKAPTVVSFAFKYRPMGASAPSYRATVSPTNPTHLPDWLIDHGIPYVPRDQQRTEFGAALVSVKKGVVPVVDDDTTDASERYPMLGAKVFNFIREIADHPPLKIQLIVGPCNPLKLITAFHSSTYLISLAKEHVADA